MDSNRHSRAIVCAVIGLGQSLNMPILAEGVETEVQFALLAREGCQAAQGLSDRTAMPESELFRSGSKPARERNGGLSRLREACCAAKIPPA
jgi:EAL domain-containing protein (putative c-di-GMP-specific phosphodiesterase class I)